VSQGINSSPEEKQTASHISLLKRRWDWPCVFESHMREEKSEKKQYNALIHNFLNCITAPPKL
jgi:hypothetical protein